MFTIVINNTKSLEVSKFDNYSAAIGMFFTMVGSEILQNNTVVATLLLNNRIIRSVEILDGKIIKDFSAGY